MIIVHSATPPPSLFNSFINFFFSPDPFHISDAFVATVHSVNKFSRYFWIVPYFLSFPVTPIVFVMTRNSWILESVTSFNFATFAIDLSLSHSSHFLSLLLFAFLSYLVLKVCIFSRHDLTSPQSAMTPNLLFIILPLLDFSISLSISLFLYYIALPAPLHKKLSRLVSISNKAGICTHVYPFFHTP